MYDALIIGAGITGSSIAMELSKYKLNICWIEKHNDVSMETTKANSGIIHAGYDPECGTKMARLNVMGSRMYRDLCPRLNIHYNRIGSLVIANDEEGLNKLKELYARGLKNGVEEMELIDRERLATLEPNIASEAKYALYSKSAAIISPWEACLAFSETAVKNGVELHLNTMATAIERKNGYYRVITNNGSFDTAYVINCAGVHADEIYSMLEPKQRLIKIEPVKGEYYLLDKNQGALFNHVIFQTPTKSGKGVLVSKTVHGNLIVGPNASKDALNKDDVSNRANNLEFIRNASTATSRAISFRENIRNFTGLRAKNILCDDFICEEDPNNRGFINFAGIKSPGLSCGPAFGIVCRDILIADGYTLEEKPEFKYVPRPSYLKDMEKEEINELVKADPRYGRVICRCETITEGEIVKAIHSVIPATTIDGVKRRTNSGMGRCQGGFCGPKILEILMRELKLNEKEVMQDKNGSYIVKENMEVRK